MPSISIITTSDGSHSLLNEELNETYHSVHGALRESVHVFIQHGFDYFTSQNSKRPVEILEIGFGTGLNALLTAQRSTETQTSVHYTSLESFPLGENIWRSLNYAESDTSKQLFKKLHTSMWNDREDITPEFQLLKINDTLQNFSLPENFYDLIFFDAFAPSKQPEMWGLSMLKKVVDAMNASSVFVTYCAKGQVKRDLKSLGLNVETLPGPPGKKEMIRATKPS